MKAIVTGITGFVGGWLAEHLLAMGDSVWGCSQTGEWLPGSAGGSVRQIPLSKFSLADPAGISEAEFRRIEAFGPDCIYHLAALARVGQCGTASQVSSAAMAINVEGTRQIARLARRLSSRPKVLFVSTSHVYGEGKAEDGLVSEDAPTRPRNGYGQSKLAAERLLLELAGELKVVIARGFQHSGPRQPLGYMLPSWAWQAARGGKRPIWAYNTHVRVDFADVRDVVRAYRLLAVKGESGSIYNVGSGQPRLSGEILAELVKKAAAGRAIRSRDTTVKFDPIGDIRRLRHGTGWQPSIPLEQTLLDTVHFWQNRRYRRG